MVYLTVLCVNDSHRIEIMPLNFAGVACDAPLVCDSGYCAHFFLYTNALSVYCVRFFLRSLFFIYIYLFCFLVSPGFISFHFAYIWLPIFTSAATNASSYFIRRTYRVLFYTHRENTGHSTHEIDGSKETVFFFVQFSRSRCKHIDIHSRATSWSIPSASTAHLLIK